MKKFILSRNYYSDVLKLAIPIIIANVGQTFVQIADTAMVGHLGDVELASAAFANMIVTNVSMLGLGLAMGLTPIVGYSFVDKKYRDCSAFLQNSILQNLMIGLLMGLFFLSSVPLLHFLGQPTEVVEGCRDYYLIVGFSLIPYMLFLSFKQFMDGLGNTRASMIITLSANLVNILLNYILIFGKFGSPALGINGAAYATLISRILMPIIYFIYLRRATFYRNFFRLFDWKLLSRKANSSLFNMGFPIASQMLVEFFALSVTGIMIGWIGTKEIAANQIVFTTISLFFLITNGLSSAATILVSHSYGERNIHNIRMYNLSASQLATVIMTCSGLLLLFFGSNIASLFIADEGVIEIAAGIFGIVAFMEIFDGLQVTKLGVLRGMGDVKRPMLYAFISYGLISLPVAYICGFIFDLGAKGVWVGFVSGLIVAFNLFNKRIKSNLKRL